jgi:PAS domain S-box-containing protein
MPTPEPTQPRFSAIQAAVIRLELRSKDLTLEQILRATLDEAEALTGSCIGFYHFVEEDQENLHLQAWSTRTEAEFCKAEGKGMHYPLSKAGVWADCLRVGHFLIHNDYESLPNRQGLPPGHATVLRELVVPVHRGGRVVAMLGVGNKATDYDESDADSIHRLADLAWHLTETKRAQAALKSSENMYRELLECQGEGFGMVDAEERFLFANPVAETIFGVPPGGLLGRNLMDFVPEQGQQQVREETQARRAGRQNTYEMDIRRPDGELRTILVTATPRFHEDGKDLRVIGVFRDITDEKQTRYKLQQEKERLSQIFQSTYEPVAQPGDIKFVNQTRASIEPKASLTHQM